MIPTIIYLERYHIAHGSRMVKKRRYVMVPRSKLWADTRPEYATRALTWMESIQWFLFGLPPTGYRAIEPGSTEEADICRAKMRDLQKRQKAGEFDNSPSIPGISH